MDGLPQKLVEPPHPTNPHQSGRVPTPDKPVSSWSGSHARLKTTLICVGEDSYSRWSGSHARQTLLHL
ncbi:MAG: hypothetical protein WBF05_06955, partial [Anaerolineales bacterium]